MTQIDWATKALARALAVIGLGVLLCFAMMTIADGLLRFFFASPIDAVRDAGALVAAFAVTCCIPVAIVERSNITIRFLSSVAGPRVGQAIGDGRIHAYDPTSLAALGTLKKSNGKAIAIDGLWALLPGNGIQSGKDEVIFSAGPDNETHGLLGTLASASSQ